MTGRTRALVPLLLAGVVMVLFGLPAAAEVVTAPTPDPLTSEDMARSGSAASKWLWLLAPVAILALWFGLSRLWRTPEVRA